MLYHVHVIGHFHGSLHGSEPLPLLQTLPCVSDYTMKENASLQTENHAFDLEFTSVANRIMVD